MDLDLALIDLMTVMDSDLAFYRRWLLSKCVYWSLSCSLSFTPSYSLLSLSLSSCHSCSLFLIYLIFLFPSLSLFVSLTPPPVLLRKWARSLLPAHKSLQQAVFKTTVWFVHPFAAAPLHPEERKRAEKTREGRQKKVSRT